MYYDVKYSGPCIFFNPWIITRTRSLPLSVAVENADPSQVGLDIEFIPFPLSFLFFLIRYLVLLRTNYSPRHVKFLYFQCME